MAELKKNGLRLIFFTTKVLDFSYVINNKTTFAKARKPSFGLQKIEVLTAINLMINWISQSNKRVYIFALIVAMFTILSLTFVFLSDSPTELESNSTKPKYIGKTKSISELSYDEHSSNTNVVYIRENNEYVPYVVLSNYYNGKTLLLREYVLEEKMPFGTYMSYYPNSTIDKYLNDVFLNQLTDLKDKIVDSEIETLTRNSILGQSNETETIIRKIFLLSATEIDVSKEEIDGSPLSYFIDRNNCLAYNNNSKVQWWLRTADVGSNSLTYTINENCVVCSEDVKEEMYIRPAFCVDPKIKIRQRIDIENRKKLWAIIN